MKLRINKQVYVGLISVLLGVIAGGALMALSGNNPFTGFMYLFSGGLKSVERIGNTFASATPLILTGLAVAFAFKTGLFNIGAAGQMLIGGLCATAVAHTMDLPRVLLLAVMLLAAFVGGGLWASLPGILKAKFNVHEVVATIMMNYIALWVVYYSAPHFFKGQFEIQSKPIPRIASLKAEWLTNLFDGSFINYGLFVAIIAATVIYVILNKTVLGFELKAAGHNRFSAEYAGMKVNRNIVLSMSISGALAGLAGATYFVGYTSSMEIGEMGKMGFEGIAVALLGANSPIGVVLAAIFFGLLHSGKGFMSAMTSIPPEIGDTIIATIIYFAATSILIEKAIDGVRRKIKGDK